MSEQNSTQNTTLQYPFNDDREGWAAYWKAHKQPWRTEPEIDAERQKYLAIRRRLKPNREMGLYPFGGIQLSRADVEWLLKTHDNGRGPVNWDDENQRNRKGLDLRGADLRHVDLSSLPLARLIAGDKMISLTKNNWNEAWQIHLEGANLSDTHLEEAILSSAHLEGASLYNAHLEEASLFLAHLEGTGLYFAHLAGANLREAFFDSETKLNEIALSNNENGIVSLVDVHWGDVNVSVVDWSSISLLGNDPLAKKLSKSDDEEPVDNTEWLRRYRTAARAYRQLATVLRNQGLNEEAARFAYRAQLMQRVVSRRLVYLPQRSLWQRVQACGSYILSLFLDILAGYGYHPSKTLFWYLLVIGGFATAYAVFGHLPLFPDALVFSFMSFHGRGFFPSLASETSLHNPLVELAAAEAVIGLFIEISFIATFTQRFFGK